MLDEICPFQFVEGINESEELTDGRLPELPAYGVSIPYTPYISYILTLIEVYVSPGALQQPKEHVVQICTDHNDNPSKICLVDGKLVVPSNGIGQWLKVELKQSVAIFAGSKYWLCFPEHPRKFYFGVTKKGEELSLRANPSGQWVSSSSNREYRFMLRFYGRVIPVATKYDMKIQT